ncbi:MAG TPA: prephenate/arogenate dehydrogenase family protein [Caulobacteraceae bacterium]|nr:prephenate/arogenate dehydrogenase family protein [Caulobacteraceae bacterium]
MSEPVVERLAVIGCGLIGSSVVRAARERGAARQIAVFDASREARERVRALGIADSVAETAAEAASGADLVIVATPPAAIGEAVKAAAAGLKAGAIVSDVGSVKAAVGEAMVEAAPDGVFIVPAHPIAGTERSGPDAGFATLFENRWTVICPVESGEPGYPAAVERVATFWRALGANVETMDARHHDLVLAVTSHLPHLIAYNIVGTAADLEEVTEGEVMKYSAGGFRDFTRIAASDPVMWRDVFLLNKDAVLETLGRFTEDLQALSRAIRWGEGDKLEALFTRTREIRRGIIAAGQESPEPNFGRDRTS